MSLRATSKPPEKKPTTKQRRYEVRARGTVGSTHLQQQELGWPLWNRSHKLQVFSPVKATGTQGGAKQMHDGLIVPSLVEPLNLLQGLAPLQ